MNIMPFKLSYKNFPCILNDETPPKGWENIEQRITIFTEIITIKLYNKQHRWISKIARLFHDKKSGMIHKNPFE